MLQEECETICDEKYRYNIEDGYVYIYKILNTVDNGKIYIGQTNNPSLRWSQHKHSSKIGNTDLIITKAMSKYGVDKFKYYVIATCINRDDANYIESIIIQQYNSCNRKIGYNINVGGNIASRTSETNAKISAGLLEFYKTNPGQNKG